MFAPILQDIDHGVPDLAWRPQCSRVEAICPDAPTPRENPVHTLRDADGEPLKPARERAHVQRFDEEMNVIALHGEVQHP